MEELLGMDPALLGLIVVFIAPVTLQVIALVDIALGRFQEGRKALWLFVVALVPFLGFILYFAVGRRQKIT
jgi:hypothetical protein